MKNDEKKLSFGLIFAGLLFFCNPTFSAIDVLPDFIGCLLLFAGLYRLQRVHPPFAAVGTRFLRLVAVDVVKDFLLLFIFADGTAAEKPTAILTTAFGAAVLELFFLIPAVGMLFDEMTSLAMRENCVPLYQAGSHGKSRGDILRTLTVAFLLFRDIVCILPEFAALTLSSYTDSGTVNLYEYIGVMRAMATLLVGVAGIVWLVFLCRYFLCVHRQKEFRKSLYVRYAAYMKNHPGIRVLTWHGAAFLLLSIGAFFTADFYLDFRNIIPDGVAALFFLAGVLVLPGERKQKGIAAVSAVLYGGVSTWSSTLAYRFSTQFRVSDIGRSDAAAVAYRSLWISALLEFVLFLVFVGALMLCLRHTVSRYAGYRPEHSSEFETQKLTELQNEMDGAFIRVMVFALLSGLCSFLYDYIKDIPHAGFFRIMEFFWFFDMLMSILFAVVLTVTLHSVYEQIQNKYQFDGITTEFSPNTISVPGNQKGDKEEHAESQSESKPE